MLKVASYNIRKAIGSDRLRRPERILDVLGEIDADIVALQEADRRLGTRASALPGESIAARGFVAVPLGKRPESIGWHGNAILVKRGVTVGAHGHIDLPMLEPRGAVWADVVRDGVTLRIVGMHLDLSGLRRRQQARAVLATLAALPPLPTVMMGDLNEWSRSRGCLHDFARLFAFAPTAASFPAARPIARLDRIMASSTLRVAECGVHHSIAARHASDHLPIWACIDATNVSG